MTTNTRKKEYINKMFGLENAAELLDQGIESLFSAIAQRNEQGHKAGVLSQLSAGVRKELLSAVGPEHAKAILSLDEQGADLETILQHVRGLVRKDTGMEVKLKRSVGDAAARIDTTPNTPPPVIENDHQRLLDKSARCGVSPALHERLILAIGADQLEKVYNSALSDVAGKALTTAEQIALTSQKADQLGIPSSVQGALAKVLGNGFESLIGNLHKQSFWMPIGKPAKKSAQKQSKSVDPFWGI